MLDQLKNRLLLLTQAIEQSLIAHHGLVEKVNQAKEQSLANHNALVGRKLEIEEMVTHFSKSSDVPPITPENPEVPNENDSSEGNPENPVETEDK